MFGMGTGVTSLSYPPEGVREEFAPSGLHKGKDLLKNRALEKGYEVKFQMVSGSMFLRNLITCGQVLDLLVPVS